MERCVCCGRELPAEGTLVCWFCEHPEPESNNCKPMKKKELTKKHSFFRGLFDRKEN